MKWIGGLKMQLKEIKDKLCNIFAVGCSTYGNNDLRAIGMTIEKLICITYTYYYIQFSFWSFWIDVGVKKQNKGDCNGNK